ncbi:MAG TPA: DUF6282 family protein [Vicinamibacterales bacterium]|nr:DUF6282 family protein [Vicinamibacterales bacterium]
MKPRYPLKWMAFTAIALIWSFGPHPDVHGRQAGNTGTSVIKGAIDIHVHTLPDDRPRALDGVQAARQAHDSGMRAIVLKNHYESTAGLAYLVRTLVPGIDVFGGIDLNLTVGGINPAAVEHMTRVTGGFGRIVWMPTFDAENQVRFSKENRPFVSVSRSGELLPEVRQVIGLIAKHNLVLATGHSSAEEGLMLLREGRRQGVQRMVVTHAMNPPIAMNVTQMQEAGKLGAFIEFVGSSPVSADARMRYDGFAAAIRKVGPEVCILSTDLGQMGNPLPVEGFAAFLAAMRERGFSEPDIIRMARENPARLLGLN